ncbi:MAG TPA: DUF5709 domain-containing protein [Marmoricola sp.]|nr:DUF5709 domain-containing protein [Marmoricola sp.]
MSQQSEDIPEQIGTDPAVDDSGDITGRENYHGYSVDDEDQPHAGGDSLVDDRGLDDPLDEGYSPPEKWSAGERYGNTPLEEQLDETLDQRLLQEVPEVDPYEEAAETPLEELEGALPVGEVGDERAGRLVAPDEGLAEDDEAKAIADDVGIDGAAASAEEAAVHVIDGEDETGT